MTNPSEKANGYLSLPFLDLSRELKSNIQMKKEKTKTQSISLQFYETCKINLVSLVQFMIFHFCVWLLIFTWEASRLATSFVSSGEGVLFWFLFVFVVLEFSSIGRKDCTVYASDSLRVCLHLYVELVISINWSLLPSTACGSTQSRFDASQTQDTKLCRLTEFNIKCRGAFKSILFHSFKNQE